jgi:hypothetical protein
MIVDVIDTKMYRKALHIYLINAYPDDDVEYYTKWAWLASPGFFQNGLPTECRFGCYISDNTKMRCYETGFMFDTNHCGDPKNMIIELKKLQEKIENEWKQNGIPTCPIFYSGGD